MLNYIKTNYTGDSLILMKSVSEMLNSFTPKGCPYRNYALLDLLKDLVRMYSWTITDDTSVVEFITQLDNNAYAIAYGQEIINIIEAVEGSIN